MRKLITKKTLSAFLAIVMTVATMAGMFTFSASAAGITVTDWNASTIYLNNDDDVEAFFNMLEGYADANEQKATDITFKDQTVKLTANVDMSDKTLKIKNETTNNQKGFSGIFDGQGYAISNISFTVKNDHAGLFGRLPTGNPMIKNVSFLDVTVDGAYAPGLLYGNVYTSSVSVENVFVDYEGITSSVSKPGGGLIGGYAKSGGTLSIKNCVVTGNVTMQCGGFVGAVSAGSVIIENCAFYGDISKEYSSQFVYSGGNYATLKHCIGLGTIAGDKKGTFSVAGKVNTTGTVISDPEISDYSGSKENTTVANLAKHARADMQGIAAQEILDSYRMTGWVATTTGYPMPKTLIKTSTPTPAADAPTNYVGYQTTKVVDGKFNLRLIGSLDAEYADLASYDKVGFRVVAFFAENDAVQAKNCELTTVYSSISADFNFSTYSESGKYLFVQECENLPTAGGDITFEVTTFAITSDGTKTMLGATYRFVVSISEISQDLGN